MITEYFIRTIRLILPLYTDGRKGVLERAGVKQRKITQSAPKELKLGDVG